MAPIRLSVAATALLLASAACPAAAQDTELETQIVDAMNKLFGVHAGYRANHAKGVVAEGSFKPAPEAQSLSKAAIFAGGVIPVTVRFSDATGIPDMQDGSALANPHGIAVKFHLPDGNETDMVTNSLKFFPVATGAEFRDLLLALADSPPNAPKPTKFDEFVTKHPTAPRAGATAKTPDSFADEEYYGIDAFVLVNEKGDKQAVRYIFEPQKVVHLDEAEAAKKPANFLVDELPARLAKGPVIFHLKAQLASPGDQTKDPSQPWPDSNRVAELGVLTIDKAAPNSLEAQKELLFLPGRVIDGIELSDDPLVDIRDRAYAVSFGRRSQ